MMVGEFDYNDLFTMDISRTNSSVGSIQFLFLIFLVFISIIIMSLLVALTVSEIEKLYNKADLIRLQKMVLQIVSTEDTIIHKPTILDWLPIKIQEPLKQVTSVFAHLKKQRAVGQKGYFKVCVRPFPKKLKPKSIKSWFYTNRDLVKKNWYQLYFYDPAKGTLGKPIDAVISRCIVNNALKLMRDREEKGRSSAYEQKMLFDKWSEWSNLQSPTPSPSAGSRRSRLYSECPMVEPLQFEDEDENRLEKLRQIRRKVDNLIELLESASSVMGKPSSLIETNMDDNDIMKTEL